MRWGRVVLGVAAGIGVVAAVGWAALQRPDLPWSVLDAKYANAASRFMDLPGGLRIHYRDQGNPKGPAIVMVHGFAASLHAWEPWVARLGGDYRIVTLDLPGYGLTRAPATYQASLPGYADLVDQVAQNLKLGPYVIVGNSMGGGVAWELTLRHPDHVRGLVLVDSVGWPMGRPNANGPLIFKILANPIGRKLLRNVDTRPLVQSGLRAAYVDPALVTPALVDRYVDLSRAPGHRDIILKSRYSEAPGVTADTFKAIHTPTLVMHGEADALIPVAAGRALAGAIPGAKLITYPGVGHVPMEQTPDRSAADLRAFMRSLDAAPVGAVSGGQ
jgi:pimeloyl-ACP methyl ester carboxylesterase